MNDAPAVPPNAANQAAVPIPVPHATAASTPIVVIMGVSGAGKSTVGACLAQQLGWAFQEGDALHPPANRDKLTRGIPLDDADRAPWLRLLADWIRAQQCRGRPGVLTCSALRRRYRDGLRGDQPGPIVFVHLQARPDALEARIHSRVGHWLPASLLDSQLAMLEPLQDDEPGLLVDAGGTPDATLDKVRAALRVLLPHTLHDAGASAATPGSVSFS